jgi:hypothetical protein
LVIAWTSPEEQIPNIPLCQTGQAARGLTPSHRRSQAKEEIQLSIQRFSLADFSGCIGWFGKKGAGRASENLGNDGRPNQEVAPVARTKAYQKWHYKKTQDESWASIFSIHQQN